MNQTVWYISKYVAPPHGDAAGGRAWELMRELVIRGHMGVVITSDASHLAVVPELKSAVFREHRDGIEVYWLRTFKAEAAKSWQRIVSWLHFEWRLLRLDKSSLPIPDVVIVSSLSLLTVLNGLLLKRRFRVPMVFEVRDIWPLTLTEEGGFDPGNFFVRVLSWIERLGYRRADAIVGTMPALGDHVREVLGEERDVRCIPMGYSTRVKDTDRTHGRRQPTPAGHLVVGYAGTVGATNALEVLFDAARLLRDDSRITLRVLGDGPLLSTFKEVAADLPHVVFVAKVPKDQVESELQKCDVLYLSTYPSRVWEFGQSLNKLVDYMLSGRPVLASFSGFPSMIDEAGSGMYVPAGDPVAVTQALRRFAAMSDGERDAMGERGRAWLLENRSYERLAADYEPILFPKGK